MTRAMKLIAVLAALLTTLVGMFASASVAIANVPSVARSNRAPAAPVLPAAKTKRVPAKKSPAPKRSSKLAPKSQPAAALPSASIVQTTSRLSQALSPLGSFKFTPKAPAGTPVLTVNNGQAYQGFKGIGAAMTDTSAWLLGTQLAPATRTSAMNALFGSSGIHLSFLRLPIGASDFTATGVPYTYDDLPAGQSDPTLNDFSIGHDLAYIIPSLQQARALNPQLTISANPWSPPAWMKANDSLNNLAFAGTLLPSAYPELAQYFVKFEQAYAAHGITINQIVPQNEPYINSAYPGMQLPAANEANFIANYLRPALTAAKLSTQIYGWDLSWGPTTGQNPLGAGAGAGAARAPAERDHLALLRWQPDGDERPARQRPRP